MRDIVLRAGTSLLAAIIFYLVLNLFSDGLDRTAKISIAIGLGVLAFLGSIWAAGKSQEDPRGGIKVASGLKGKNVKIDGLEAEAEAGQQVHLASNIDVTGDIEIKGVKANAAKRNE